MQAKKTIQQKEAVQEVRESLEELEKMVTELQSSRLVFCYSGDNGNVSDFAKIYLSVHLELCTYTHCLKHNRPLNASLGVTIE